MDYVPENSKIDEFEWLLQELSRLLPDAEQSINSQEAITYFLDRFLHVLEQKYGKWEVRHCMNLVWHQKTASFIDAIESNETISGHQDE
jgi:hypothetical protein